MFGVKDFYPSINEGLLIEALEFAKQDVAVKFKDGETIIHVVRKSFFTITEKHELNKKAIISTLKWIIRRS